MGIVGDLMQHVRAVASPHASDHLRGQNEHPRRVFKQPPERTSVGAVQAERPFAFHDQRAIPQVCVKMSSQNDGCGVFGSPEGMQRRTEQRAGRRSVEECSLAHGGRKEAVQGDVE